MPEGQVLEFSAITKRFGAVTAVSNFSARVEPGRVTGFLGPNGAGKTTTLRILLGLVRASDGTATIGGVPYSALKEPLRSVGAVLEASSFHPGRTAANHLKVYAQAAGLPLSRVGETLGLVGLADVGGRKVGGFSLGMRQRLGLAYALLGDPGVLVLDEPANGLDPEGIKWMRGFLRQLAREGRTVFVSSHLLAEVQQTVDSVLIIAQGRLVYQGALEDLADPSEFATVVDSPDRAGLSAALRAADAPFELLRSGLTVRGLDPAAVGAVAASAGVALSSLQRRGPALEEIFLDLVSGARVHPTAAGIAGASAVAAVQSAAAESAAVEDIPTDADATAPQATLIAASTAAGTVAWAASESNDDEDAEPALEAAVDPSPSATFAVASTGVIDIVPFAGDPETDADQDGLPLDGDADVEALGAIDAELSEDDAPPDSDDIEAPVRADRPWENYTKTEADVEADAFFASFTAAQAADAAADGAGAPSVGEPSVGEPAAAEPESDAKPEPEPESVAEGEPEPEPEPVTAPDAEPEPDAEPVTEPEPEPVAEGEAAASDSETDSDDASDDASDEPDDDTSELGTLADLSPDWVEDDIDPRTDDDPSSDDEEGEQR